MYMHVHSDVFGIMSWVYFGFALRYYFTTTRDMYTTFAPLRDVYLGARTSVWDYKSSVGFVRRVSWRVTNACTDAGENWRDFNRDPRKIWIKLDARNWRFLGNLGTDTGGEHGASGVKLMKYFTVFNHFHNTAACVLLNRAEWEVRMPFVKWQNWKMNTFGVIIAKRLEKYKIIKIKRLE